MKDAGGLAFSLLAHALLILLATVWVVSSTTSVQDDVGARTFVSSRARRNKDDRIDVRGAGGQKENPRRIKASPKVAKRISSKLSSSRLNVIEPLESLPNDGLLSKSGSKTLSGRGFAAATGGMKALPALPPFTMGTGPTKATTSAFGFRGGTRFEGMTGTYYDLSQLPNRIPRGGTEQGRLSADADLVQKFLDKSWSPTVLSAASYQAPEKLICQQVWVPHRYAGEAPTAFGVTLSSGSPQWLIHYQCMIEAPDDKPFRFIGYGRNCFWVRWDRKVALEATDGWIGAWRNTYNFDFRQACPDAFHFEKNPEDNAGAIMDHFRASTRNAYVYDLRPVLEYIDKNPGKPWPDYARGDFMRAGPWITPVKGRSVPFEILLGTLGNNFEVFLAVEWADGPKSAKGAYKGTGKLRMFRCGNPTNPNRAAKGQTMTFAESPEMDPVFKTS